jgi:segregation and condensation protein A
MSYKIKLDTFEGPLDLLLFFIHRDRINVYDIPISHITEEFLTYIQMMKTLNIEVGGEFVLMASMLMRIKTKMLLPVEQNSEDDEIIDPRTDLVQKILEYKQYKEASEDIQYLHDIHYQKFNKGIEIPISSFNHDTDRGIAHISLFDLLSIYKQMIEKLPETNPLELNLEEIHLDYQIQYLSHILSKDKKMFFSEIFKNFQSRNQFVITFLALLEMLRLNTIKLEQKQPFCDIMIGINT